MKSEGEKLCPACFMQIDARAKKCPHCHTFQNIFRHAPAVAVLSAVLLVGLLIFILVMMALDVWLNTRNQWRDEDYTSSIVAVNSDLYFAPDHDDAKVLTLVGTFRNDGTERVDLIECRVQAFDANGKLIDYFESDVSTYLLAGETVPFKISDYDRVHTDEARYVSHQLTITGARQQKPKSIFDW